MAETKRCSFHGADFNLTTALAIEVLADTKFLFQKLILKYWHIYLCKYYVEIWYSFPLFLFTLF